MKTLTEIFRNSPIRVPKEYAEIRISGVQFDSRKVKPGDLFVAIPGFKVDGHLFLKAAAGKGAVAALVNQTMPLLDLPQLVCADTRAALSMAAYGFHAEKIEKLKLVGVTGTNGKTTTTYLIQSLLNHAGLASGLIGTIAYDTGKKRIEAWNTTPEAADLGAILTESHDSGLKAVVMEVSSHALDLKRVAGLQYDVAVFTNLTRDHLDYHQTEEAYFQAKRSLFAQLKGDGRAVINCDDPFGRRLIDEIGGEPLTFGFSESAAVRLLDWSSSQSGTRLTVSLSGQGVVIQTRLISRFNMENILAALGAGMALNIAPEMLVAGIESVKRIPGRLEVFDCGRERRAVIDYAHTPDALEKALGALREITSGRLICVFGCGGDRDKGKRPQMGRIAEENADLIIVTDDNPRTEDSQAIINDIVAGMSQPEKRKIISNRRTAIFQAVRLAQPNDLILLAGKGHEQYQEIKGVKFPFNEADIIREASSNA
jgi:UDP-N-acetylmuramoyl-L-alanyl-D-glutamate--2,6-diaminopimelate ligase